MRVAILDLGTNTFNIFIADLIPSASGKEKWSGYKKLYKSKISVKLGEEGINKNHIEERPFRRGLNALMKHKKTITEYGAEKIIAVATSAIRSASNGQAFIQEAKKKTGIEIRMISGDKEAELIYYGVRSAVKMNNSPSLIMDIGGGSTELIIANQNEILWEKSFLLGAARLLEKFRPSDPITEKEIKKIENYLEENLQPFFEAVKQIGQLPSPKGEGLGGEVVELIGSSGSFDSLAEMIGYRYYNTGVIKGITEYEFNLDDCEKIYKIILQSTTQERLEMKGLTVMRVDMIVVSAIFVNYIFARLGLKKMRLSRYSLKEGVMWEFLHS